MAQPTSIKPQLSHLMKILAEIAPRYSDIGTALNVPDLGLIPLPQFYNDNLRQTLRWWINNGPTVGSPVTYDNIIDAIKGSIVQNFRVSEILREDYEKLKQGLPVNVETTDGPALQEGLQGQIEQQPTPPVNEPSATSGPSIPNPPSVHCPPMRDIESNPTQYTPDLVKDVNVILVTATKVEFRAVMGQAEPLKVGHEFDRVSYDETVTFYLGMYGQNKVAIIQTRQGGRSTREMLPKVQEGVKAKYVIAVGICYGMKEDKVKLGDVIVARHIHDSSSHRAEPNGTVRRSVGDWTGQCLYNILSQSGGFKLKKGDGPDDYVDIKTEDEVLVSESTLVASQEEKDRILRQIPQALGGEMEGAAIMELARSSKFEAIVVKAVADYGNENKEPYRKWQEFAAVAAAEYVMFHLKDNKLPD